MKRENWRLVNIILIVVVLFATLSMPSSVRAAHNDELQVVDVTADKVWTITFNQDVVENMVNENLIEVLDSNNKKVPGIQLFYGDDEYKDLGVGKNAIMIAPPSDGYTVGQTYTLNIKHDLQSEKGGKLKHSYQKQFKIIEPKKEEVVEQVIDDAVGDLDIKIDMEITDLEKELTIIEEKTNAIDTIGEDGLIGEPISIYSPVENVDASIEIAYKESQIKGIEEENIRLFYHNPETEKLELVKNQQLNTANNTVIAKLDHFSTYLLADISKWNETNSTSLIKPTTTNPNVVSSERNPLDIIFVIDSSGSMGKGPDETYNQDLNNYRISGTKRLIDLLYKDDMAAVVDFDSSAKLLSPLTLDRELLKKKVDTIDSYGGTNIPVGIKKAMDEFAKSARPSANKIMILLTDGRDSPSRAWKLYQEQINRARALGVKIYTVGLGENVDIEYLEIIAKETGGDFLKLFDSNEINNSFDNILENEGHIIDIDTDLDGIPDWVEKSGYYFEGSLNKYISPTDPYKADSDGDGFTDAEELGDFYYDEASRKIIISRTTKYNTGIKKEPYLSNPNNADETPENWLTPSAEYNPRMAKVAAYASHYAYKNSVDNAEILINNGFKDLQIHQKRKLNILGLTVSDMQVLTGYKKLQNGKNAYLIAFRGSQEYIDWITDIVTHHPRQQPYFNNDAENVILHAGFADYTNAFIEETPTFAMNNKSIASIIEDSHINEDIFIITGHSLGGAAAEIFAGHLKDVGVKNIVSYTFAAPPIAFKGSDYFDSINIKRIYNFLDPVVTIPEQVPLVIEYTAPFSLKLLNLTHVNTGVELPLDINDKQVLALQQEIDNYNKLNLIEKLYKAPWNIKSLISPLGSFHSMNNVYIEYLDRLE